MWKETWYCNSLTANTDGEAGPCRFFCGPHAKKSHALAKQQKKRPRGGSNTVESSGESSKFKHFHLQCHKFW